MVISVVSAGEDESATVAVVVPATVVASPTRSPPA